MNDHDMIVTIQEILSGVEWGADTCANIACLLNENGYRIRDVDEITDEEHEKYETQANEYEAHHHWRDDPSDSHGGY